MDVLRLIVLCAKLWSRNLGLEKVYECGEPTGEIPEVGIEVSWSCPGYMWREETGK